MLQNFLAWQIKKKIAKGGTWQAFKEMLVKSGKDEITCDAVLKEISKLATEKQRAFIVRTGLTPSGLHMQTFVTNACIECTIDLIDEDVVEEFFGNIVEE